ncbi:MAG TPA: TIM barrel protein, partial [Limnochordia bacterium]|nr:TIM barrel protein [Limnochordia bacterium]
MRLGGPVVGGFADPERWISELRRRGYTAAYCPVDHRADAATVRAVANAAERAGVVIAEVGAWSNPLSPDEATRRSALAHCIAQLDLAERIGARCCVNISGSCAEQWDGPHAANLTEATFERIVDSVRTIIDAVKPQRTCYTLETMPWAYPNSVESYARLIQAIDRPAFAVHFDPVNLISSPERYYDNAALIRAFVERLGPSIKSCHAKDIRLAGKLTVHLDEVRPGLGELDYAVLLTAL